MKNGVWRVARGLNRPGSCFTYQQVLRGKRGPDTWSFPLPSNAQTSNIQNEVRTCSR